MKKDNNLGSFVRRINRGNKDKITEESLIKIIEKVAGMHSHKIFGFHTQSDLHAQIWIIVLKQLQLFDITKAKGTSTLNSIERWLNTVVRNRLNNYFRDNYIHPHDKNAMTKLNIINMLGFQYVDTRGEKNFEYDDEHPTNNLIYEELKDFVVARLSDEGKDIYHDCIEGESVSSYYKTKLMEELKIILEEWYEETESE